MLSYLLQLETGGGYLFICGVVYLLAPQTPGFRRRNRPTPISYNLQSKSANLEIL